MKNKLFILILSIILLQCSKKDISIVEKDSYHIEKIFSDKIGYDIKVKYENFIDNKKDYDTLRYYVL